jgi:hypothetical protein
MKLASPLPRARHDQSSGEMRRRVIKPSNAVHTLEIRHHPKGLNCVNYIHTDRRPRGHHPALRAKNATTAMPMATVPKINCKTLKPRNGIWKSNSVASNALATSTAIGAQGERRHASQAAKPEGRATVRK